MPDCCESPADCSLKDCKNVFCQNGNCIYVEIEGCCLHNAECWDDDSCTFDKCINGFCDYPPTGLPGCD